MRYVVGYPFYLASPEMCQRVIAGLANLDPQAAEVVFLLDGNDAAQRATIERAVPDLDDIGLKWTLTSTDTEIRDGACHNYFIDHMLRSDAVAVVVPQDDIYLTGKTLLPDLDRVLASYGDRVGMIGLRHGCDRKNTNLICARFDVGTHESYASDKVKALPVGEWAERLLMTPGPLVYPRSTVEKIGKLDPVYRDWFWWSDYCMRAHLAGLKNVVMAIDALHFKCGIPRDSHVEKDAVVMTADLKVFNDKYRHVFGGDVL